MIRRSAVVLCSALTILGCSSEGDDRGAKRDAGADAIVGDGSRLVATLGDSITAGTPRWDPDPDVRDGILRPQPKHQWQYWAARANDGLRFRNCGVNRQRTDEIAERLTACLGTADVLVVQGGINDLAQGRDVEHASRNLRKMVVAGQRAGATVLLTQVLPWNAGYPDFEQRIEQLNDAIAEIGADLDVAVLPFYDTLEDPDAPGRMRDAWTSDGSHPSVDGHRRLGEVAFELADAPA